MYFVQFLLCVAVGFHNFKSAKCQTDAQINYFVNVIEDGIAAALNYTRSTSAEQFRATEFGISVEGIFDFIVVGGGTAGSTIASRLSEIPQWSTLLLEAGTWENDFVDVPAMSFYTANTRYNWNYKSLPQTTCCLGLVDNVCPFNRGRGLGGSTLLNACVYSRASRPDFTRWAADIDKSWNYDNVLKYYIRAENATAMIGQIDEQYHGYHGPMDDEHTTYLDPQAEQWITANNEIGVATGDYNGESHLTVSLMQINTRFGRRLSTARAYLQPAQARTNLRVSTDSYVIYLQAFELLGLRKVIFTRNGRLHVAFARKEIILSAGSIASPQILMLSGIGPEQDLRNLGIPVVRNLPVGRNLHDHPLYFGTLFSTNITYNSEELRDQVRAYLNGRGFLTVPGNYHAIGFYDIDSEQIGYANIEMMFGPSPSYSDFTATYLSLTEETFRNSFQLANPNNSIAILVILLRPLSRGTVRLASADPYTYPLIDPRYFTDPDGRDIQTIYNATRLINEHIATTEAFRSMNATLIYPTLPRCAQYATDSQDYWYCTIRQLSLNVYHAMGTNKMGKRSEDSVVDTNYRVHGYKTLRVIDSSVFPFPITAHPSANVVMVAERAFDIIKKDHGL